MINDLIDFILIVLHDLLEGHNSLIRIVDNSLYVLVHLLKAGFGLFEEHLCFSVFGEDLLDVWFRGALLALSGIRYHWLFVLVDLVEADFVFVRWRLAGLWPPLLGTFKFSFGLGVGLRRGINHVRVFVLFCLLSLSLLCCGSFGLLPRLLCVVACSSCRRNIVCRLILRSRCPNEICKLLPKSSVLTRISGRLIKLLVFLRNTVFGLYVTTYNMIKRLILNTITVLTAISLFLGSVRIKVANSVFGPVISGASFSIEFLVNCTIVWKLVTHTSRFKGFLRLSSLMLMPIIITGLSPVTWILNIIRKLYDLLLTPWFGLWIRFEILRTLNNIHDGFISHIQVFKVFLTLYL